MSVLDLKARTTSDKEYYKSFCDSSSSKIYVEGPLFLDESGEECLKLTVGDTWFDANRLIHIPPKGVEIKPRESIVFVTEQSLSLPRNVFGIVFGVGANIFRGGFIASGKIDPGFRGKMKIGYYNGGSKTITLKKGDKIAGCVFFNMETSIVGAEDGYSLSPQIETLSRIERTKRWMKANGLAFVSVLCAIISTSAAVITLLIKMAEG